MTQSDVSAALPRQGDQAGRGATAQGSSSAAGGEPTRALPTSGGGEVASSAARTPSTQAAPARPANVPNRQVRLTVARVDPFSVLKLSFLLSVALGIAMVVAVMLSWLALQGLGVFDKVDGLITSLTGGDTGQGVSLLDFVGFGKVTSLAIVFAVIDVVLFTAIATLAAFLYNVTASLVGGLHMTLTDD